MKVWFLCSLLFVALTDWTSGDDGKCFGQRSHTKSDVLALLLAVMAGLKLTRENTRETH